MQSLQDQTPPPRPASKFPLKAVFLWASVVSFLMWAVLLSLIFTGHTKVIWTAEKVVHATGKVAREAHRQIGKAQGDRDLTLTR